jgi:glutamate-1-semialdehyde 2,1-aminomutase
MFEDRELLWTLRAQEQLQFDSVTRRSAELGERARRSMPDGVPMAWMAGLYGHRPLFVAHADGCRFTDVDGTTYVDFNQADLSATSGFTPPAVL